MLEIHGEWQFLPGLVHRHNHDKELLETLPSQFRLI